MVPGAGSALPNLERTLVEQRLPGPRKPRPRSLVTASTSLVGGLRRPALCSGQPGEPHGPPSYWLPVSPHGRLVRVQVRGVAGARLVQLPGRPQPLPEWRSAQTPRGSPTRAAGLLVLGPTLQRGALATSLGMDVRMLIASVRAPTPWSPLCLDSRVHYRNGDWK